MMTYKKLTSICMLLTLFILVISSAAAFGVTTVYWKDKPLEMYPEEVKVVPVILQNMKGEEAINVRAEMDAGQEIAELVEDRVYVVPVGRDDVEIPIKISIPKSASVGAKYNVGVKLTQQIEEDEGLIQIASAFGVSMPVVVVEEPESESPALRSNNFIMAGGAIILLVILVILYFVLRGRKSVEKVQRVKGKKRK